MAPTLRPGDTVFVDPALSPQVNDVVCAVHPHEPTHIVKRVAAISGEAITLRSDNPQAPGVQDSRYFGPVEAAAILGVVTSLVRAKRSTSSSA